jgi:hypothetical protein
MDTGFQNEKGNAAMQLPQLTSQSKSRDYLLGVNNMNHSKSIKTTHNAVKDTGENPSFL